MTKNGYPIHVKPVLAESVGNWVIRFQGRIEGIGIGSLPTRVDFDAHGVYPCVTITKNDNEEDHVETRRYAKTLLADLFDETDYYFSPCLRIWFTDEDKAMTFKLCWNR